MKIVKKCNLKFKAAHDKLSLIDVFYPSEVGRFPVVVFAHGFKGFKDWGIWNLLFEKLCQKGFVVIKFNFSHNGGTLENPMDFPDLDAFAQNTYTKELSDLNCVMDLIHQDTFPAHAQMNLKDIHLIGHSRGGGISILHAAKDDRIKKLICWASVSDFYARLPNENEMRTWQETGVHYIQNKRTGQNMPMNYSFVEDLFENRDTLDILKAAEKIRQPWLILHGTEDNAVSHQEAIQLSQLNSSANLVLIDGANHVFGGRHPYGESELPDHAQILLARTLTFLKS